jgi:hypothetical protein
MHARLILLLVCAALSMRAAAQQQPADEKPAVDRIVERQPDGGPYVFSPPLTTIADPAVLRIARAAGITVGFEAVPGSAHHVSPDVMAEMKTRERVSLAGKTVRGAFDTIAAIDDRYHWVDVHGVPVMRPRGAWVDPLNPLNRVGGPIDWQEVGLGEALKLLVTGLSGITHESLPERYGRTFSLELGTAGLLEMLNEISLAHGGLMWEVRHSCRLDGRKWRAENELSVRFISLSDERWEVGHCILIPPSKRVSP